MVQRKKDKNWRIEYDNLSYQYNQLYNDYNKLEVQYTNLQRNFRKDIDSKYKEYTDYIEFLENQIRKLKPKPKKDLFA
jgi:hypothetical protein